MLKVFEEQGGGQWDEGQDGRISVNVLLSRFIRVQFFGTLWSVALQAPLSMGFSRQEYWSKLPFPSPGDLSDPGIEPVSLMSPALAGRFFTTSANWEADLEQVDIWCLSLPVCEMERCQTVSDD